MTEIIEWWSEANKRDTSKTVEQADRAEQQHRHDICIMCEDLVDNFVCKHCGCFMPITAKAKNHKCPRGKW